MGACNSTCEFYSMHFNFVIFLKNTLLSYLGVAIIASVRLNSLVNSAGCGIK